MLAFPTLEAAGVTALVTTRSGGVSRGPYASLNLAFHVGDDPACVLANRARVAGALEVDPGTFVVAEQVHGHQVAVVAEGDAGRGAMEAASAVAGVDAMVTTAQGLPLMVLVADCVPVVMVDPAAGVLACTHAGWRGIAAGLPACTISIMEALGASPERLLAGVGPAADPATYQVDDAVAGALATRTSPDGGLVPDGPGRWLVDLGALVRQHLVDAGVPGPAIHCMARHTSDPSLFSHRRGAPTGRFALLAMLAR